MTFFHQDPCIISKEINRRTKKNKKKKNALSGNDKESVTEIPKSVHFSRSDPKVNGVCSGRRAILYLNNVEINPVVFV